MLASCKYLIYSVHGLSQHESNLFAVLARREVSFRSVRRPVIGLVGGPSTSRQATNAQSRPRESHGGKTIEIKKIKKRSEEKVCFQKQRVGATAEFLGRKERQRKSQLQQRPNRSRNLTLWTWGLQAEMCAETVPVRVVHRLFESKSTPQPKITN